MSPRRCVIVGCNSVSGQTEHQGVTFHSFPLNATTRKIWVANSQVGTSRNITKSTLVCSRHFRRADFQPLKNNKYFLKQGAVPSIFPWGNLPHDDVAKAPSTSTSKTPIETIAKPDVAKESSSSVNDNLVASTTEPSAVKTDKLSALKPRSASAEEHSVVSSLRDQKADARKSLDSATLNNEKKGLKVAQTSEMAIKSPQKRLDILSTFVPGAKLEAQDLNGAWHNAKVMEVDHGEQEVLIHFEKNGKVKGPA